MRLPYKSHYPREISIPCKDGDFQTYTIKWVRKFRAKDTVGECDPGDYEIRLKLGQSRANTFKTFIHEVLHALDFEGTVKLSHKAIYGLEEALFLLLRINL